MWFILGMQGWFNIQKLATIIYYTSVDKKNHMHWHEKTIWQHPIYTIKILREWYVCFQGKPFNTTATQVYAPTSNAEEAEVQRFSEDLQDLLELTPKKDVLFIRGDWNAKVRSQELPGIIDKFGLGVQNEAGQRLIEFCQENAPLIANTLFQ